VPAAPSCLLEPIWGEFAAPLGDDRPAFVVLAGALTEALPVAPGDVIVAHFDRLGSVELACS
jgi:hypothetical protein